MALSPIGSSMASLAELLSTQNEMVSALSSKSSHTEMRAVRDNMRPHEAVRLLTTILSTYDEAGVAYWPLRQMRDMMLDYFRTLRLNTLMPHLGEVNSEVANEIRELTNEFREQYAEDLNEAMVAEETQ